jgi:hypothetical protein
VVASFRRREVCQAGRHHSAELTNGASSLLPRRLARADVCPRRANVAALTLVRRREAAALGRLARWPSADPGHQRCALKGNLGGALSRLTLWRLLLRTEARHNGWCFSCGRIGLRGNLTIMPDRRQEYNCRELWWATIGA